MVFIYDRGVESMAQIKQRLARPLWWHKVKLLPSFQKALRLLLEHVTPSELSELINLPAERIEKLVKCDPRRVFELTRSGKTPKTLPI